MNNYLKLLSEIQNRYNPDNLSEISRKVNSEINSTYWDANKYVRAAMMEVDALYTQKTMEAGENVKAHLKRGLYGVEFDYQGSVMTRTHIRGASDIDLLTFTGKFNGTDLIKVRNILSQYSGQYGYFDLDKLKRWERDFKAYTGNYKEDLRDLRLRCESILQNQYKICDISKPKSIKITNLHLNRDVDIVVCNRFDSVDYIKGLGNEYRGVEIYDKHQDITLGPDYPFLSIKRINTRSSETGGRLKKMIRFLKNVRTDSDKNISLTSFDINAICYDIDQSLYRDCHYLDLVRVLNNQLNILCQGSNSDNLKSVVGDEYIFKNQIGKRDHLLKLRDEVNSINNTIIV